MRAQSCSRCPVANAVARMLVISAALRTRLRPDFGVPGSEAATENNFAAAR